MWALVGEYALMDDCMSLSHCGTAMRRHRDVMRSHCGTGAADSCLQRLPGQLWQGQSRCQLTADTLPGKVGALHLCGKRLVGGGRAVQAAVEVRC
jgi:hypothetical protein